MDFLPYIIKLFDSYEKSFCLKTVCVSNILKIQPFGIAPFCHFAVHSDKQVFRKVLPFLLPYSTVQYYLIRDI